MSTSSSSFGGFLGSFRRGIGLGSPVGSSPTSLLDQECHQRAEKASNELATAIVHIAHESSMGLYRIQEHIHKKTPQIVNEKDELSRLNKAMELSLEDAKEAQQLLRKLDRIDSLLNSLEKISSTLESTK